MRTHSEQPQGLPIVDCGSSNNGPGVLPRRPRPEIDNRQSTVDDPHSTLHRWYKGRHVHLIGIGGSGMSGVAALLLKLGADVSGSDLASFDGMGALVGGGARVEIGHREQQLDPDVDQVVISAAIPEANPELVAARGGDIPVLKYAELVGTMMRHFQKGVAIAGTHGKSTTTAMCAYLCREAGLQPSFLIGARSAQLNGSSALGTGPHFIVESCEFDRSFLRVAPESAAVLNIEPDHLDCYRDLDEIIEAFSSFCGNVNPDGLLVCNAEDRWVKEAARSARARIETFGLSGVADWQAVCRKSERGCYAFDVRLGGTTLFSTRLSIPGRHNVANALAAIALAYHAGAEPRSMATALPAFGGIDRRLTWRGRGRGVNIVDDYAHHPTEVRVTIEAVREGYKPKRTWVVFQPHQHARTQRLMDEFADSFGGADEIIVPDVYAARESSPSEPQALTRTDRSAEACSKELVSRICQSGGRARYLPSLGAVVDYLIQHVQKGDLVLTMGAGDVGKVADELVERICEPHRA